MPIRARFVIGELALATVVTLVVLPAFSLAEEPRYKAVQVARYVLETPTFAHYSSYRDKIKKRTLTYDSRYRHPFDPAGPAQVDCTKVGRVGVMYYVVRSPGIRSGRVKTRIIWEHSNVELDDRRLHYYHSPYFQQGIKAVLVSYGVRLWDELRADGILSVRVLIDKEVVLENSFSLVGCPIVGK